MERQMIKQLLTAKYIIQHLYFYSISNLLMASSLYDKQICIGELNNEKEASHAATLLNDTLSKLLASSEVQS